MTQVGFKIKKMLRMNKREVHGCAWHVKVLVQKRLSA